MKIKRKGYGKCAKCEADEVRTLYELGEHTDLCGFCLAKIMLEEKFEIENPDDIEDMLRRIKPNDDDQGYRKIKYEWTQKDEEGVFKRIRKRYGLDDRANKN